MRRRPTNEQFRQQLLHMIQTLKSDIAEGRYGPGEDLPSEKALAARFGLSNISVRKGLATLAEEGLIEKIPNVGNRVLRSRQPVALTLGISETTMRNMALPVLLEQFERKYPWIKVKVRMYNASPHERAVEDAIDVLTLSDMQFQLLREEGRTAMLEDIHAASDMHPFLNDLFMHNGKPLLRPLVFGPVVLCYNKRHFREKGLAEPTGGWTWNDLVRAAASLTEGERYGFCFHLPDTNRWPIFLLQSGERQGNRRERSDIVAELLTGARQCKDIVRNRDVFPTYVSANNMDIDRMFLEGKLSMVLTSYMALNDWKQVDLEYDVSPVPFIREPRTMVIVTGAGVSATSRQKEEARLLVDYLSSYEAQCQIRSNTLSIPALPEAEEAGWGSGISNVPSRYMLYREMIFSYRTHRHLPVVVSSVGKLSGYLRAYWADMIAESELSERLSELLDRQGGETAF